MTLNDEQLKEIENYLMDMPTKFGLPLLNYLAKIKNENQNENENNE